MADPVNVAEKTPSVGFARLWKIWMPVKTAKVSIRF